MPLTALLFFAACMDQRIHKEVDVTDTGAGLDAEDPSGGAGADDTATSTAGDTGSPVADSDPDEAPFGADDTAGADTAWPADDFGGEGDSDSPADTGRSPRRDFTFSWVAPSAGAMLEVHGELSDPDSGIITMGSSTLTREKDTHRVSATLSVCQDFTWRGQGAADLDGDGAFDMWSCQRQSTEEVYAVVGEVTCEVEGEALDVVIAPADDSDGCGVRCTWRG